MSMSTQKKELVSRSPATCGSSLRDPQLVHETQATWIAAKPECAAALTLEMVDQGTQYDVLPLTAWAMIDLLPMNRTTKMLVQGV